jgi:hypothetical protein
MIDQPKLPTADHLKIKNGYEKKTYNKRLQLGLNQRFSDHTIITTCIKIN